MKVFDEIKSKNIDELAEWLDKYGMFDGSPWVDWFDKNYCKKCEPVIAHASHLNKDMEFAWCELNDNCRYFTDMNNAPDNKEIIKLWLGHECE